MLPKGIKYGNEVRITLKKGDITGILLQRSELLDDNHYNLKLPNGYNMGVAKEKVKAIAKIGEGATLEPVVPPLLKQNRKLPKIGVVTAGGTIVARLDYASGGVKYLADPRQLLAMCPIISSLAQIDQIKSPVRKDSSEIESDDWKKIANDVYSFVHDDDIAGVLVLIGTDSLHYSSAALSFMLRNLNKPVVLTYSHRSTDRASTDALLNLEAAVRVAISGIPAVLVVGHATSNDTLCQALRGTTVRKFHTSRRDGFRPVNDTPVAMIDKGVVDIRQRIAMPTEKPLLNDQFEKKIAFIHYVPNMDPGILDYYLRNGYTGAIISMLGLGQIAANDASNNWLGAIKDAIKQGMVICATAQTIYGALQPNVYATGRYLSASGVIYLGNMLSETAYVKLGCALGRWSSRKQVEQYMLSNIAGEFQEFLSYEAFLN